MGIKDYNMIFDELDRSCHGFLTADQLQEFHKSVYLTTIPLAQINTVIKQICGASSVGKVTRDLFLVVLSEIERRRLIQEEAYWDFRALDLDGNNKISLKDALILFREFHGENFSLDTWNKFISSREYPYCDIYYDEIRAWLCEIPEGTACTDQQLIEEERRLDEMIMEWKWNEYETMKTFEDNVDKDDYRESVSREANRKLNKWNRQGVEALLYDDGLAVGEDDSNLPLKPRNSVNINDLLDSVDQKYNILQDRLLLNMAEFAANMENEVSDIFQDLRRRTKQMIKDKSLTGNGRDLLGGMASLPYSLLALLGHHKSQNEFEEIKQEILNLKEEGKSEEEIRKFCEGKFENLNGGSKTAGDILEYLEDRRLQEKQYCLGLLHKGGDGKSAAMSINSELASLHHQHDLLGYESDISSSILTTGLGERSICDKLNNLDELRSKKLVLSQLEEKKGRKQIQVSEGKITLDKLDNLGIVDLRLKVISEIDRKHFFEREAMISMLQGPDSKPVIEVLRKLSEIEKKKEINHLRNQHQNWLNNLSSFLPDSSTLSVHYKILHKAVGLYWLKQQAKEEERYPNISNVEISSIILSKLNLYQEAEVKQKIEEIQSMSSEVLRKLIRKQHKYCINECFDGIANVTMGTLVLSDDDKEFIEVLDEKYSTLREKLFICMLQHKHGLDWINLDDKIKEKELHKLRKEEKKLRATQNTEELAEFLGPKIMEISSKLCYSLGSPKWITLNSSDTKSENILSYLIERYDEEQQALITWLQTDAVKKLSGRKKRKEVVHTKLQIMCLKLELDLQTSYLMNGMIERLEDGEDTTRLTSLSEVSVKSWRDRLSHGIHYKPLFQDLQNMKRDDITSWQFVYLTEVKYRHSDEREVLLEIVKEMSSDFLQEAAAMMGEGDRQKRLSELQTKYLKLDLSSKDDYEDYRVILEEAGAIQVICRKALLQKERRRGITAEMTAVSLLYDLYHQQFKELRSIYTHLDKIEEADLIDRQSKERVMRKNNISPNVIKVLTVVKGAAHDHDLLQVVDRKYDVLKDRLLSESIKQSMEPSAWSKLSKKDKLNKVNKLKESTEIHWRQANIAEFALVLGNDFNLTFDTKNILGCDRENFRQSGLIEELKSETCSVPASEVVQFLYDRLEEEKESVLNMSQGSSTGVFLSDGNKFALVARLKREVTVCDDQDSLYLSSLSAGLLERQSFDVKNIPVNDQKRYKILAEDSIKWCEGEKNDIKIESPIFSTDIMELENDVLKLLYIQHKQEQLDWYRILSSNKQIELRNTATVQSKQQRNDRLITLTNNLTALQTVDCKEYKSILLEAMVYKKENILSKSEHQNSTMEDINIIMMSLLLQYQNSHAEKIIQNFSNQTTEDLTWLSNQITSDQHKKKCQNIVEVVFSTETSTESTKEDLLAALEGKYDALRDKLIIEALIAQYGELDWSKITDAERQKKVFEMKLKERRLRKEGKIDEVNKLIGESLKHQEALTKLMGDNKADADRKLRERLEKRKQRIQEGKTEEECMLLEEEDIKKEEENTNILQELESRFCQEKEKLLNQLSNDSNNTEDIEKLKHELIKLRQDERKARNEDGFESAALVIGLAQKAEEDESEKERQWRLAKERLLASRRKRGTEQKKKEDIIEEDIENINSKTRLREILLMLNDKNHTENRNYLIQLLEDVDEDKIAILSQLLNENLETKISESCELRKKWKESTDPNEDDELTIFKEICGCTVEIKRREKEEGYDLDEVKVELLADLQHLQDIGTRKLRLQIPQKEITWLKEKITEAKQGGNHDNVGIILFLGQGQPVEETNKDEHLVIAALEKKYDVMRDKLIVEALMREIGQAEWSRLSQLQKQKQVIQIKLENRRLRREGKMVEEISDLIKEHLKNTQGYS
ncbi:hypothetical protein LOTGIDRAFT_164683 [Lottia gigantea]|uniref:EF-hand domain-containing protein n=1 Tax=Lottia gigantea TaxID=225164 RepID=V4BM72_LOTGI|nr:hypothetical protein LOTGIDRAFT_164683 [Lottia gigantea]ESO89984.1 hypothetical protein LOTGIDRAFT_164683 [Lottia gigantea]